MWFQCAKGEEGVTYQGEGAWSEEVLGECWAEGYKSLCLNCILGALVADGS